MRFYYVLGRIARPGMAVAFYIHGRLFNQQRSRVIAINEHGEILLIRNWAGHSGWSFPGGGVERGEDAKMAAKRELLEETGIDAPLGDFVYMATLKAKNYEAPIYTVRIKKAELKEGRHNPREITHIGWYAPGKFPKVVPLVAEAMQKLASKSEFDIM